jgi:hypothetical protein
MALPLLLSVDPNMLDADGTESRRWNRIRQQVEEMETMVFGALVPVWCEGKVPRVGWIQFSWPAQ